MKPSIWSKSTSPAKLIMASITLHRRTSSIFFNNWTTFWTRSYFTPSLVLWPNFNFDLAGALSKIMKILSTFPTNFLLTFSASDFQSYLFAAKSLLLSNFLRFSQLYQIFTSWSNTIHDSGCILCNKKIGFKL